ncbi:MAG TPA: DUF222 domain-containing protein [Acidimicrobiales bacterium]|nr:DUF222 domain-containing protein [Acidimicrobiales bacterium]
MGPVTPPDRAGSSTTSSGDETAPPLAGAPDGAEPGAPPDQAALALLAEAVELIGALDPGCLGRPEAIKRYYRLLDRLQAHGARAAAALDASGAWARDTARSATAWLATNCDLARPLAARRVRVGSALRRLPEVEAAWTGGELGTCKAEVIAGLAGPGTAEALVRDETVLLEKAKSSRSVEAFARTCASWSNHVDVEGGEDEDKRRAERRDVRLLPTLSGNWHGTMTLDPVSGEIVNDELSRIEQELYDLERTEAEQRLGREPRPHELERTASQRRADALVEMAARSGAARAGTAYPVPLFNVLVDFESFGRICQLASGAPTTPAALVEYLQHADIERAVFDPPNRVDVGQRQRFFTGATRRAIELRDRRCSDPYCDRPAMFCQVDHIVPYSDGGETTQENGRLLCEFHNRQREHRRRRGTSETSSTEDSGATTDSSGAGPAPPSPPPPEGSGPFDEAPRPAPPPNG